MTIIQTTSSGEFCGYFLMWCNNNPDTTNDSDDCGSFIVYYHEPVITGPVVISGSQNTPVKVYDTGLFDVFIMPNDFSY